jgi:hypothetical protein
MGLPLVSASTLPDAPLTWGWSLITSEPPASASQARERPLSNSSCLAEDRMVTTVHVDPLGWLEQFFLTLRSKAVSHSDRDELAVSKYCWSMHLALGTLRFMTSFGNLFSIAERVQIPTSTVRICCLYAQDPVFRWTANPMTTLRQ